MEEVKTMSLYSEYYLKHYGVKGMKWGVRRYQNKDGTLTPAGKKRYNTSDDGPKAEDNTYDWGSRRKLHYENKNSTAKKAELDKLAEDDDYWEAMSRFDDTVARYHTDLQKKGRDYAEKALHDSLKDYSYQMYTEKYAYDGEEYVSYWLEVVGNKYYYTTGGDGDYFDDQEFGRVDD
jgi:hypothetical protein